MNDAVLKEFGFSSTETFPRLIDQQEITLTLPTATDHVDPVGVEIASGLLVPVPFPSILKQGMIIADDGSVVSISQKRNDPSASLEVQFIETVPYDARVEVNDIMRRAVMVDERLAPVWRSIRDIWIKRFTPTFKELDRQSVGNFEEPHDLWKAGASAFRQLTTQIQSNPHLDQEQVQPQMVLQTQDDFEQGWLGREVVVDRISLAKLNAMELDEYFTQRLGPKLKDELADPLYHPDSTFQVYYEARLFPTVKAVVMPPHD